MSAKAQVRAPQVRADASVDRSAAGGQATGRNLSNSDRIAMLEARTSGEGDGLHCSSETTHPPGRKKGAHGGNPGWSTKKRYVGKLRRPRIAIDPNEVDGREPKDEGHEPEPRQVEVVTRGSGHVDAADDSDDRVMGSPVKYPGARDSQGNPLGNQHYALGQYPLFDDTGNTKAPAGGKLLDEEEKDTVTGKFSFSIGEGTDRPGHGGTARFTVTAVKDGERIVVYAGERTTTLGQVQTVTLSGLVADAIYEVDVDVDTWWGGETPFRYQLTLDQHTERTSVFEVGE